MSEFTGQILLLGNYVDDAQESMLRFGNLLLEQLRARGLNVDLIRPERVVGKFFKTKWGGYVDKLILFPGRFGKRLRQTKRGDVLHICDHVNAA